MSPNIFVTVQIIYNGPKALEICHANHEKALEILKQDLLVLKIPYPKTENVSFPSQGCAEFFWTTYRGSTLHKQLQQRAHSEAINSEENFNNLSINYMSLDQRFVAANGSGKDLDTSKKKLAKRIHPYHPEAHSHLKSSLESRLPLAEASQRNALPDSSAAMGIDAQAQRIIDESFETFRKNSLNEVSEAPGVLAMDSPTILDPPIRNSILPHQTLPTSPFFSRSSNSESIVPVNNLIVYSPAPLSQNEGRSGNHVPLNTQPRLQPTYHASDLPTIQRLTRELHDIRREMTAQIAREADILQILRELNAPNIPELSGGDFVMKTKLQMIESQLKDERQKRKEAEDLYKDIERECTEPFVVPALLEAFATLSRLTSESLR